MSTIASLSNQIKSNLHLNQAKAHTHRHTHTHTQNTIYNKRRNYETVEKKLDQ